MDIEMPVMNGIEATRKIRASGNDIKIIALTSHKDENLFNTLLSNGFNAYLTKPFTVSEMRSVLG